MKTLLVEIGTEEIPARFISEELTALREKFEDFFKKVRVDHSHIIGYSTPRRLAVLIKDVSEKQDNREVNVIGPPKRVAFDATGSPTKAALGFAKSQNVDIKDLRVVTTNRGEYLAVETKEEGAPTVEVLQRELSTLITSLPFPRSMRWGEGTVKFVRPICWICAMFGEDTVLFELERLKSDNVTYGHRFLSPDPIRLDHPEHYASIMTDHHVLADPDERKSVIVEGMKEIESQYRYRVTRDDELLDTVTALVEYPTVILGSFDVTYLALPKKLLVTVMKSHQKYFSVEDNRGDLLPHFVVVSNTLPRNNDIVRRGAERVLKARLEDATFYYDEDRKSSFWNYVEKLKKVTFHEELGSMYEKCERMAFICSFIADTLNLETKENLLRAVMLSKADLVTGVVREFPELQGYMGMTYAYHSGEESRVADAIFEHYLPTHAGDRIPESDMGRIISLADKIDNISSFFLIGIVPTGSEDPFALRRQAAGILLILQNTAYPVSLDLLIETSLQALESYSPSIRTLKKRIIRFFLQRFEHLMTSQGYRHDVIQAALTGSPLHIRSICARIESLSRLRESSRFAGLLAAAKRVYNILQDSPSSVVNEDLFIHEAERELLHIAREVGGILNVSGYDELFRLEKPINCFFDEVLVMDKQEEIKANRLALLGVVRDVLNGLGDFSKVMI